MSVETPVDSPSAQKLEYERRPSSNGPHHDFDPESFRMTIGEHLEELRTRLILGLVGFIVAAIVCFIFGEHVVTAFLRPLMISLARNQLPPQVVFVRVEESFMVYIKISLISAAVLASPWMLYQLWQFVAAGLYAKERKYVTKYLPLSIALLITGMLFLYFFVLPIMLEFFLAFNIGVPFKFKYFEVKASPTTQPSTYVQILPKDPVNPQPGQLWFDAEEGRLKVFIGGQVRVLPFGSSKLATPLITLADYIDMVVGLLLSFGLAFQMPLVVLALVKIGIVEIASLKAWRRYVYFSMSIIAAFIVPDVATGMIALMVPLILLYEFGIFLAQMAKKKEAALAA